MNSRDKRTDATYAPVTPETPDRPHRLLVTKCIVFGCDRPVSDLRWALGHYTCGRHDRADEFRRSQAIERRGGRSVFSPATAFTARVDHAPAA